MLVTLATSSDERHARLLRDAAVRLRAAHGTTYARALGHSSLLTLIPAVIAVIGLVAVFDLDGFARVLEDAATSFAPGPAGSILTEALAERGSLRGTVRAAGRASRACCSPARSG